MPHSEIRGSKGARPSPRLFAACHVLHRLSVPRHPPNALTRLIRRPAAAHREHNPPCRHPGPRLTLSTHVTRLANIQDPIAPEPASPAPAALNVRQSHSYPQCQRSVTKRQRPEDRGQNLRTPTHVPMPSTMPRRPATMPRRPAPASARASSVLPHPSLVLGLLVEPTGLEPATPCLQSRRSPS